MADGTPSLNTSASLENKSTSEIRHEMQETRESITEKVAALENQVLGTIQTAADTVANTVEAVKEAVTSAPAAVSDTVKQTVDAVKESVGSFSVSECVGRNPWAALGASVAGGFVIGYGMGGRRTTASADAARRESVSMHASRQPPGLMADLCEMTGRELRQLAEQTLSSFLQSLKRSIGERIPDVVETNVNRMAGRLQTAPRTHAYASGV